MSKLTDAGQRINDDKLFENCKNISSKVLELQGIVWTNFAVHDHKYIKNRMKTYENNNIEQERKFMIIISNDSLFTCNKNALVASMYRWICF